MTAEGWNPDTEKRRPREAVAVLVKAASESAAGSLSLMEEARQAASGPDLPAYLRREVETLADRFAKTAQKCMDLARRQMRLAADEADDRHFKAVEDVYARFEDPALFLPPRVFRADLHHPWIAPFPKDSWEDLAAHTAAAAAALRPPAGPAGAGPGEGLSYAAGAALRSCWIEGLEVEEPSAASVAAGSTPDGEDETGFLNLLTVYERLARYPAGGPGAPLTAEEVLSVHGEVMRKLLERPGRVRDRLVRVGRVYVAPDPPDAEALLRSLAGWLYEPQIAGCLDDLTAEGAARAFARAAWAHLRFEQIHPFLDGNGRMGRWLEARLMSEHPLLRERAFDGSVWCWDRRGDYYKALRRAPDDPDGGTLGFVAFAAGRFGAQLWERGGPQYDPLQTDFSF